MFETLFFEEFFKNKKKNFSKCNESKKTFLEKAIQFKKGSHEGRVVILAGGAGSGKDFTLKNLLDFDGKIIDCDDTNEKLMKLRDKNRKNKEHISIKRLYDFLNTVTFKRMIETNPLFKGHDLEYWKNHYKTKFDDYVDAEEPSENSNAIQPQCLNLKDSKDVAFNYNFAEEYKQGDKILKNLLDTDHKDSKKAGSDKQILPDITINTTLQSPTKVNRVCQQCVAAGYELKDINLVWILTPIDTAKLRNKGRERSLSDEDLVNVHNKVYNSINKLFEDNPLFRNSPKNAEQMSLDGDIYIVFAENGDLNVSSYEQSKDPTGKLAPKVQKKYKKDKDGNFILDVDGNKIEIKPKVSVVDSYKAVKIKSVGKPIVSKEDIPNLPLIGRSKGENQGKEIKTVGDLLNKYTGNKVNTIKK